MSDDADRLAIPPSLRRTPGDRGPVPFLKLRGGTGSGGGLTAYDAARRALAAAHSVGEVKEVRDKAEALRLYAQQAKDIDLLWMAAEIKVRAERRAGDLLAEMDLPSHRPSKGYQGDTLKDVGVTKLQSSRWQQAAAYPEADFEAWLAELKGRRGAFPTSSALRNLAKIARAKAANADLLATAGKTLAGLEALAAQADAGRTFGALLIDFPWRFETWSERGTGRSAAMHYPTMSLDEILALAPLIARLAAKHSAGFFWLAWPHLMQAGPVIEACGFTYSTCAFDWIKRTPSGEGWHKGQGHWTMANNEPCLIATRGSPPVLEEGLEQILEAPVGAHSAKPAEAHARIERLVPGPYLELFARQARPGWTCWGNEVEAEEAD